MATEKIFYKRGCYREATTAISAEQVVDAVMAEVGRVGCQCPLNVL